MKQASVWYLAEIMGVAPSVRQRFVFWVFVQRCICEESIDDRNYVYTRLVRRH